MKNKINGIIASMTLLSVIISTGCTSSMVSQEPTNDQSKKENHDKKMEIEQPIEKEGISGEELFVIDTESPANIFATNTQRYYVLRKTNINVPASDHEKQGSLIFIDIFNDGADAYVWEDLSSYNYCDYSKSSNAIGTKTELDPALIPYEQFLRDNDLEDYISADGIYSDEELTKVGEAMGILEGPEKNL